MSTPAHALFLNLAIVAPFHTYLSTRSSSSPSSSTSSSSSSSSPSSPTPSSLASSRFQTLLYTLSLLVLLLSLSSFHAYTSRPSNYFELLEVDRNASPTQLKQAYKRLSLTLHPDKNPNNPSAAAEFAELTLAYETLLNPGARVQYDLYGPQEGLDVHEKSSHNEMQLLVDMLMYYLVSGALSYLFLAGPAAEAGRIWSFIALVLLGAVEYSMLFSQYDPFVSFLPRLTIREKVEFLHLFFPFVAHVCRLLSISYWVDRDVYLSSLLEAILLSHKDLKAAIGEVETALEKKASGGKGAKQERGEVVEGFSEEYNNLSVGERLKKQQQAVHLLKHAIEESKKKQGGLPSWAIMVGMYVLFNYVLK